MIEDNFGENFLVKQTETPRPKTDEIDQEYAESDREYGDDRPDPFQNALHHVITSARKRI